MGCLKRELRHVSISKNKIENVIWEWVAKMGREKDCCREEIQHRRAVFGLG